MFSNFAGYALKKQRYAFLRNKPCFFVFFNKKVAGIMCYRFFLLQ